MYCDALGRGELTGCEVRMMQCHMMYCEVLGDQVEMKRCAVRMMQCDLMYCDALGDEVR